MVKVSDSYSLDDLCEMTEEDMATLLKFYASNEVPWLGLLRESRGEYDVFDGSFGFCVGWG
jgi:precorrin-2 dehydrogenase/sirohydrochlorin ferrochelatase